MADLAPAFAGRRVLVTGHTGFKGAWLALILARLGAKVTGLSLPAGTRSLFGAARVDGLVDHRVADIRDAAAVQGALAGVDAEVVFHLAAQALVRPSYADPAATFATNVVGTCNVLDAARTMPSLAAVVVVTSDKCYDNAEWVWGFRESDPMGGSDPYSASKGCAELVAQCYRRSYFSAAGGPALATARAGNVFGGGDFAADRIVADMMAAFAAGEAVLLRNPASVRPFQHVLDPLSGYLALAAALLSEGQAVAEGWNFGPDSGDTLTVAELSRRFAAEWPGARVVAGRGKGPHEARTLRLDSTKARTRLGWRPQVAAAEAVRLTIAWHRAHAAGADMRAVTLGQIDDFISTRALQKAA